MKIRDCLRNWLVTLTAACYVFLTAEIATTQVISEQPQVSQQNSTKKIRVKPSTLSAKAGSAVKWSKDLDTALQKAESSGKPVFWYVPTIRGTFMDRKPVVDRYMMSGFFSWPDIISELNENFVPVKAAPSPEHQKRYELSRYKFIEPGFLILAPDGSEKAKVDRLTTQHPAWLWNYLKRQSGADSDIRHAVTRFPPLIGATPTNDNSNLGPIAEQIRQAMLLYRSGDQASAVKEWQKIAKANPDHPLGWKAAAEAQGIGPFSRGFEVFVELPERAFLAGIESAGSAAPPETFSQSEIWNRSVDFLLGMQCSNGGFFDSDYDFGGTDSLPNVHVAVTALVGMALLDAKDVVAESKRERIEQAVSACLKYVTDEKNLNRIDRDEILWADAYRVRFISRCSRNNDELSNQLQSAVEALEKLQSRRGSWYHEYANAFVTATALAALHEAKQAGAKIDQTKVDAGVKALAKLRSQDGSFPYYSRPNPEGRASNVPAAAGRMPICEFALHTWGQSDQTRLKHALEKSFEFHRHLDVALKYDNHTSTYAYGGFFFWYDMRSRTEAITAIQDNELRNSMMQKQLALIMQLPELDGCFIDSHELGRCYGTAMALLCLKRIHEELKD